MLLEFILFVLAVFVVFYLPGKWLLGKLAYKGINAFTEFTFSLGAGIALFLIGTYALSWVHVSILYLFVVLPIVIYEISKFLKQIKKFSFTFLFSWEALLILCGIIVMIAATVSSGLLQNGQMIFHDTNKRDGIWHVAFAYDIIFKFPPDFPGLAGVPLRGYHILYDLLVADFAAFFRFNAFDLYFRFFSLFTALFLGLSGLTLAFQMKMNTLTRRVFLFFLYFSQGLEFYLFHWFNNGNLLYDSPVVQPAKNIVDPSIVFSTAFVLLLGGVWFYVPKKKQLLLPVLFLSIVPGIKIYTGILAYAGAGIVTLYGLLKKKYEYLYVLLAAGLITATVYVPFNLGAGTLVFAPFLVVRHFFESQLLFMPFQWPLKLQVYQEHHNILRVIYLYGLALLAFLIPSLGIRLVTLTQVKKIFAKKFYTFSNIFWFALLAVGFIIPIFFIQSVGVFNIIQLYWVEWIVLALPTAYSIHNLIGKPSKVKILILFAVLIILSFPTLAMQQFPQRDSQDFVASPDMMAMGKVIEQTVPKDNTVMVINRIWDGQKFVDAYQSPLVFGTFAKRPMYFENELTDFSQAASLETARKAVIEKISLELMLCSDSAAANIMHIVQTVGVQYLLFVRPNSCAQKLFSKERVSAYGDYSLYRLK